VAARGTPARQRSARNARSPRTHRACAARAPLGAVGRCSRSGLCTRSHEQQSVGVTRWATGKQSPLESASAACAPRVRPGSDSSGRRRRSGSRDVTGNRSARGRRSAAGARARGARGARLASARRSWPRRAQRASESTMPPRARRARSYIAATPDQQADGLCTGAQAAHRVRGKGNGRRLCGRAPRQTWAHGMG
jgi:hypothetical protein